jgi:ABC-type nitrate/sulfonate/bicarbonate transport system permease component
MKPSRGTILAIQLGTVAVALAAYEALARSHLLYEGVVPPLGAIGAALGAVLADGTTYTNFGVTVGEVLVGFTLGTLAGIAVGLWAGARPLVSNALGPYLDGIATAPKIVFFPIALLLFGVGPGSKTALGALSAFFPVAITVAAAVRRINPVFVAVGRSFNLSRAQMVRKIYLPALVPAIVTGMRIGLGVTIIGVLLGEIKLSDRGIGFQTIDAYNHYRIPQMYALLFLIFIVAVAANALIGRLDRGYR